MIPHLFPYLCPLFLEWFFQFFYQSLPPPPQPSMVNLIYLMDTVHNRAVVCGLWWSLEFCFLPPTTARPAKSLWWAYGEILIPHCTRNIFQPNVWSVWGSLTCWPFWLSQPPQQRVVPGLPQLVGMWPLFYHTPNPKSDLPAILRAPLGYARSQVHHRHSWPSGLLCPEPGPGWGALWTSLPRDHFWASTIIRIHIYFLLQICTYF